MYHDERNVLIENRVFVERGIFKNMFLTFRMENRVFDSRGYLSLKVSLNRPVCINQSSTATLSSRAFVRRVLVNLRLRISWYLFKEIVRSTRVRKTCFSHSARTL